MTDTAVLHPPGLDVERLAGPDQRAIRRRWDDAVDRFLGSDPGLTQLRTALMAVLGIGLAVVAEYTFVRATHAMQIDTHGAVLASTQANLVHAQHHGMLVIAMLLGALMAMFGSFVVNDATARGQLVTSVLMPVPMLASMVVGLALGSHRIPSLTFLVVALMVGTYLRRFGPRGFGAGLLLFNGGFMGFFLSAEIPLRNAGWVAVELAIGTAASLFVRFAVFRPDSGRTLARMQRSWVARSRTLVNLTWAMTDTSNTARHQQRLTEQMHRQLLRLNESTLMIDAQLGDPTATSSSALRAHQLMFDMELALTNVARFTAALTVRALPADVSAALRDTLAAVRDDDLDGARSRSRDLLDIGAINRTADADDREATTVVLVHRLVGSVKTLAYAQREWLELGERVQDGTSVDPFVPAVKLFAGWLPGSAPVSAAASTMAGRQRWDRSVMAPEIRASIQIGIAGVIAISVGDQVSGHRLYYALLATFLAFMATTNSGEQIRKALFRVGGTGIGIVIGDLLVHLSGHQVWISLIVIMVALFLGIYLIRINYMFMVIGITVTMSQLYVQLDEFSWHLLVLRLAETGIGVASVVLVVLFVFPLRPQRVLTVAVSMYLDASTKVVDESLAAMTGRSAADGVLAPTRADVRALDLAYQSLVTTATPLRHGTFGRNSQQLATILSVTAASRYYLRNLANGVDSWPASARGPALQAAAAALISSREAIRDRISTGAVGSYTRSSSLFDAVDRELEEHGDVDAHLVLRDLMLYDGACAQLATALGMAVLDNDTVAA
jgi:uncharacterized membrane protein YccC